MIRVPIRLVSLSRLGPLFVLVFHLKLALGEVHQRISGSVAAVVPTGDGVPMVKEPKCGKCHDLLVPAEIRLFDAVHLGYPHRKTSALHILSELLPGRVEALAPNAPGGVEVHERKFFVLGEGLPRARLHVHSVHPIFMEDVKRRVLLVVVVHLVLLAVPTLVHAPTPVLVELPLFNVSRHVLPLSPNHIQQINSGVVARQVMHRDVKIDPDL
mmetsp:Transcript_2930/g.8360  ORF Transcript_2930/g.8360 Transcript_2930/m.8360 type:complete len:213 (-) Transcript_2930:386-1024(-)